MYLAESVKMAVQSIGANKLRAGLTLLSISIGVFAIVGVAAAVGALEAKIDDQLSAFGRNSFIIQKNAAVDFGGRRNRNRKDVTLRQAQEFKRRLTSAQSINLTNQTFGAVLKYNGLSTDPNIIVYGSDEGFTINADYGIAQGRTLDAKDVQLRTDVAVIGDEVAATLFPGESPVGKIMSINSHPYTVIGVFAAKGAVFGQSQDALVVVPITSAAEHFFDEWGTSTSINVRARSVETLDETIGQAVGIMRAIRGVEIGAENDFEIITNESITETFGDFTQYVAIFGLFCGAVSLLAAGIGIMNIMLVSVKERTREIGVRKAVGATSGDILTQFMIEAVTLCQFGAVMGIGLGLLGGMSMGALLGIAPPIPWMWVGVSIGVCTAVGLIFGIYPAWRASRLDPIEALRYE